MAPRKSFVSNALSSPSMPSIMNKQKLACGYSSFFYHAFFPARPLVQITLLTFSSSDPVVDGAFSATASSSIGAFRPSASRSEIYLTSR